MIGHNTFEFFGVPRDLRDRNYHKLLLVTAERRTLHDPCQTAKQLATTTSAMPFQGTLSNATMATSTRRGVFNFFGLPRELRDLIYDELDTTTARVKVTHKWSTKLRAKAHDLPAPKMLQLSHRFSTEYRSIVRKKTTLVIEDHFGDFTRPEDITVELSRSVSTIQLVRLELYIAHARLPVDCRGEDMDCCITGRDIALHKRWIPVLLAKLSQLTSLTVDVHIPYQCGNAEKRSALVKHVSALTTLSGLEAITVIVNPGVRYEDVARWDYTSLDKQKVMTWKRTTGEFLDFEP
ncbi:hypothetical protein LTR91_023228 [Friedmanniomyces endolithicus]|uniref:Uncharacterized protein n=1 Tax=Friedmanniomyces endolithicus TaxID=329885 RepID=A0AAN6JYN3_9PEZI|nr:hypothetical protein LTR94_016552 [Friedmanniomyces endolithicus]KAK0771501.1 hypothetical protein LTR59_016059 [Friedmanniomyces endolithicus]KAK0804643.1 hypothetical protein LTR38_005748 [Friedmanniomyces endolithicus]KAK0848015.1 hypothetical protein LTS02_014220 [Friedmanniomyces endolithicus]KAK0854328.1 hypothetical protein LTR03_002359 [Friedmanniomyces endolithicus]